MNQLFCFIHCIPSYVVGSDLKIAVIFSKSLEQRFPSDSKLGPSMAQIHHPLNFSWDWSITLVCPHQIWHFHESTLPKWPYWFNLSWMSSFFYFFYFSAWPGQCEHEKAKDVGKYPLGRRLSFYLKNNSQINRGERKLPAATMNTDSESFYCSVASFPSYPDMQFIFIC